VITQGLTAALSFAGAFTKRANKALAGVLSFSGAVAKRTSRALLGSLSYFLGFGSGNYPRHAVRLNTFGSLSIPDDASLDIASDITVRFWFTPLGRAVTQYAYHPLRKGIVDTIDDQFVVYFFGDSFGAAPEYMGVYANAGSVWKAVSPQVQLSLGKPHRIVWRYNSSTGGTLHVNGVSGGAAVGSGALASNSHPLNSGAQGLADFLLGDLRINSRYITDGEIADDLIGVHTDSANLVGHWKFDEGSGTTANDSSPEGNHGTLSNQISWNYGGLVKRTYRALAGVLSFAAAFTKRTFRSLVGAVLSFSGASVKRTNKVLAGVLSFSGAFVKRTNRALAATLSFTGAFAKLTSRALAATLSFAGTFAKLTSRALAATLSFAGTFFKRTSRAMSGVLSFSGAMQRAVSLVFAAFMSFSAGLVKHTLKVLSGVLSFSGNIGIQKIGLFLVEFGSALSFTGRFLISQFPLNSALSFSAAMTKSTARSLAAVLTSSATFVKTGVLSFVASLSPTGEFTKHTSRALNAAMSFAGTFFKHSSRALAAVLALVSPLGRANLLLRSEELDNAAWTKDGGISVTADQAVAPDGTTSMDQMTRGAGTLSWWSQLTQAVAASPFGKTYTFSIWVKALSGTKDFTLAISDVFYVSKHSGQMVATTTSQRFTWEGQTGWDAAATLIGGGINITDATGDLMVWGAQLEEASSFGHYLKTTTVALFFDAFTKRTFRALAGALSFSAAQSRAVAHVLASALSFSGAFTKRTIRALSAPLSFAGSLVRTGLKDLLASLSFSGAWRGRAGKALDAALSFAGALTKRTSKSLGAIIAFAGGFVPLFGRLLSSALSFSGGVAKQVRKLFLGSLTFAGLMDILADLAAAGGSLVWGTARRVVLFAQKARDAVWRMGRD
jgi:hypothetical protein